ncbi:hypothetical protein [Glycomyces buryatensis]|uniref:Uncharacterized protein n=1 Tax=Glycomyces buryatensis TaxID=2570927 RepID=A0A4S8PZ56_9ACTN|nr:hypothetical protein [Glycomyces buryatensis]THV37037.1 hypothetical protein FAB82_21020 [Glycomyces buryatensis]
MTDLSDFEGDARALILDTPRAVMEGAIVVDGEVKPMAFLKELTAGASVFREAQRHENAFVRSVAVALRKGGGSESEHKGMPDPIEAVAKAHRLIEETTALLRERADEQDAAAYGAWLVRLATKVAEASKSKTGGLFSKKVAISEAEREFIEQVESLVVR